MLVPLIVMKVSSGLYHVFLTKTFMMEREELTFYFRKAGYMQERKPKSKRFSSKIINLTIFSKLFSSSVADCDLNVTR